MSVSDPDDTVLEYCRALLPILGVSKVELAQELRSVADILELEMVYTDPPLATTDPARSEARARPFKELRDKMGAEAQARVRERIRRTLAGDEGQ